VPPQNKFSAKPKPPFTTKAPFPTAVEPVVSLIVTTPSKSHVCAIFNVASPSIAPVTLNAAPAVTAPCKLDVWATFKVASASIAPVTLNALQQ